MPLVTGVVTWPLLLLKSGILKDPGGWFSPLQTIDLITAAQRERDLLQDDPPPCGPIIRYRPTGGYEKNFGEFLLDAEVVEKILVDRLGATSHLDGSDDEALLLNWIRHRTCKIGEPVDIPDPWCQRFRYIVDDLARVGGARVNCLRCGDEILSDQLLINDDDLRAGQNFNRISCPQGHQLLVVETVHLMVRS